MQPAIPPSQASRSLRWRGVSALALAGVLAALGIMVGTQLGSASANGCPAARVCPATHHDYVWRGLSCTTHRRLRLAVDRTVVHFAGRQYFCHRAAGSGARPSPPRDLRVTGVTQTTVSVAWRRPAGGHIAGFELFRNGRWAAFARATTFSFTGLTCATTYRFTVRTRDTARRHSLRATRLVTAAACPASGSAPVAPETAPSPPDTAPPASPDLAPLPPLPVPPPRPPDTAAPTTPKTLSVETIAESSIAVTWTPSTDDVAVAGYNLLINGSRLPETTAATSFTFSSLACATKYTLGVQAVDSSGNVSAVASSKATTSACPPPAGSRSCPAKPLGGVQDPGKLKVLDRANPCRTAVGVIASSAPMSDGDCHIKVKVDAEYRGLGGSSLVTEVIPKHRLPIPKVGSRVSVTGTWVRDVPNGWNELHPVWSFEVLSGSTGGC